MSDIDYLKGYRAASDAWANEYGQLKHLDPKSQLSTGYCYIIALENDEVKIGFTHTKERLIERWKEISLDYLYKVHPLATLPGGFMKEQFLHRIHNRNRIPGPGERFKLTPVFKAQIDAIGFHRDTMEYVMQWYGPNTFFKKEMFRSPVSAKSISSAKQFKRLPGWGKWFDYESDEKYIHMLGYVDVGDLIWRSMQSLREENTEIILPNVIEKDYLWGLEF